MGIVAKEKITYLFLNGIKTNSEVQLNECVVLKPADMSHLDFDVAMSACEGPRDIAVVSAFVPIISAQLEITGSTVKEAAILAWNAQWDGVLLSAVFNTEIGSNLQGDAPAEAVCADSNLRATNFLMHGFSKAETHELSQSDIQWLEDNFGPANELLSEEQFQSAIQCMATYRWHSHPRIQLAVLWAGIEGLFGASSEIRFRLSLYVARFLYPDTLDERKKTFESVKKLYNVRSAAVHGSKLKSNVSDTVSASAKLLQNILIRCIELRSLPDESELVP